jgi:hypothetical protein
MITKLNRGRNARRVIKKPVLWNRRSRGCCMETSTLEDVISCRAPKCVADAKIYTMQLLLGQYWFTELHTTSYYTKWSAVIVLLHLTYQIFCVPESIFCLFFFGLLSCFLFFIRLTLDENVHVILVEVIWMPILCSILVWFCLFSWLLNVSLIRNNSKLFPVSTCDNKILNSFICVLEKFK